MAKVTGIGGVFIRSDNPKRLQAWYVEHLGLEADRDGYIILQWGRANEGTTVWSPFKTDAEYFGGPGAHFMINYRVDDLDEMVTKLVAAGVEVGADRFEDGNGRFAHCWDPEGNKIELWEPSPGM
ncbi:MAG: VOC family protein [Acidimicrobiia bacterium]|nr:VOC family protein [Acidimicrobiia bacterium]